jgi:hypothetical protein
MFGLSLRVSASARKAVERRCGDACEVCGLEWPWLLYLFPIDDQAPKTAANLIALCVTCSSGRAGPFAPLLVEPSLRDRLRRANNRRTGATPLTAARRRKLIEVRGGRCQVCSVNGSERQLEVHHRLGVLQGGDDSDDNLMVLCFACHHHLRPCATGCGGWAKLPAKLCRHCETRRRLEARYAGQSWAQIKSHLPALARSWPAGYEPRGERGNG